MRIDFENLKDGERIVIYPLPDNPIQKKPQEAIFDDGYFYLIINNGDGGPDYYFGDIARFCLGYDLVQ